MSRLVILQNAHQITSSAFCLKLKKVLLSLFQPPVVPKIDHDGDTQNFEEYPEEDWKNASAAHADHQAFFEDF